MVLKLSTVTFVALFSLSGPQSPQDEIAALRKQVAELKASQEAMQRDLDAIKSFLQALAQGRQPGVNPLEHASVQLGSEPTKGSPTAKVTLVEISDYHCPFCRRHMQMTQPQIDAEYIATGKVRYVFVDYPIAQLHPDAFKAHEAADCAGEQGKYWEMHAQLFAKPTRDPAELTSQAAAIGVDKARFRTCLESEKYRAQIQQSVDRMQQLGVDSTPTFLIGPTPSGNAPMKVVRVVNGALPFDRFKTALDAVLSNPGAS
jgi:protein-disulfide isomerase